MCFVNNFMVSIIELKSIKFIVQSLLGTVKSNSSVQ